MNQQGVPEHTLIFCLPSFYNSKLHLDLLKKRLIFLFERDRGCTCVSGGKAEGENLQAGSLLNMEPNTGFDPIIHEIMT